MRTAQNLPRAVGVLSLFFVLTIGATNYFASSGSVEGDGNSCLSAAEPCNGILAALALAQDGDQIILLKGTYSGSLNVPFTITQANLTITAEGATEDTVISCGHLYPFCMSVVLSGATRVSRITFSNYTPFTQREIWEQLEGPAESGPFHGMITVHSKPPQNRTNQHHQEDLLLIEECVFQSNQVSDSQDEDQFNGASLVFVDKLMPHATVKIFNSDFNSNTVSCVNAYYSNVLLEETSFKNNQPSGLAAVLTATTHNYFGGVNIAISQCTIESNNLAANTRYPTILFDGTPCSTSGRNHSTNCSFYSISNTQFNSNGGKEGMILLSNGAQLLVSGVTSKNSSTAFISTPGGGLSRITPPSKVRIESSEFSQDFAILSGFFVDSLIYDCSMDTVGGEAITVSGSLNVTQCSFSNWTVGLNISRGEFSVSNCTFSKEGNAMFVGDKLQEWADELPVGMSGLMAGDLTTVVISRSSMSTGFSVRGESLLFFDSNEFYPSDAHFECFLTNSIPSILNFVGGENSISSGFLGGTQGCKLVCNPDNNFICESEYGANPDDVIQSPTQDFETWEIFVLIIIGIVVIWAVVASGLVGTYVYTMLRPLPEAQSLIND